MADNTNRSSTGHEAAWRKSSYSGASNGSCLEVNEAHTTAVPVRDSKSPTGPALFFPRSAWSAFVAEVREDR